MTTTSKPISNQLQVDDLAGVRGTIITPDDPQYDGARAVYNGAVDLGPQRRWRQLRRGYLVHLPLPSGRGARGMIIGGPVLYALADVEDLFRWYRDLLPTLPEDMNGWIGVTQIPAAPPFPEDLWSRKAGIITWCYTGPHAQAEEALAPIRGFGHPLLVGLAPMPYPVLQNAFDGLLPKGLQWYWKADFFEEITDEAIAIHRRYGESIPTPLSTMHHDSGGLPRHQIEDQRVCSGVSTVE